MFQTHRHRGQVQRGSTATGLDQAEYRFDVNGSDASQISPGGPQPLPDETTCKRRMSRRKFGDPKPDFGEHPTLPNVGNLGEASGRDFAQPFLIIPEKRGGPAQRGFDLWVH